MNRFLEALPVVGIFVLLLGPALYFGQYWLAAVFGVFGLCFGVIEVVSIKTTGKSVSQKFWALKKKNKKAALIIIICMILAWACLIYHFWAH